MIRTARAAVAACAAAALAAGCAHRLEAPGIVRPGTAQPSPTETAGPAATLADTFSRTPTPAFRVPGTILVADQGNHRVVEIDGEGKTVWQFGTTGTPGCGAGQLNFPSDAWRLPSGTTLIADFYNHRVIEVDSAGTIRWEYGTCGVEGSKPGLLRFPGAVQPLPNGNVLVTDTLNHRVIEVNRDKRIEWQFGINEKLGVRKDKLNAPASAYRLPGGHTLITDEWNDRVFEVDEAGAVTWEYGGLDPRPDAVRSIRLNIPCHAVRIGDDTLICDFFNDRIVLVGRDGKTKWQYGHVDIPGPWRGYLHRPAMALPGPGGSFLIADRENDRALFVSRSGGILWQFHAGLSGPTSARLTAP